MRQQSRQRVSTGSPFEPRAGISRALRTGRIIAVTYGQSSTTQAIRTKKKHRNGKPVHLCMHLGRVLGAPPPQLFKGEGRPVIPY
jgi:hypothetical protein